eukprot:TRINITY_DN19758_c0_g1_i1.p3 TRINITY_DN19758_c0_g1~~TRINITY_DN19758_c0_g1_i1.p3  ORF type:complete len:133 (-),score=29.01 TRINITY_DN19758_c0_g1_i1:37-435(-)
MDVEGAEHDTLVPWLAAGDLDGVRQLLVEIHSPRREDRYATTRRLFAALDAAGWVITHKESNLHACGRMQEYAFLKLDWPAVGGGGGESGHRESTVLLGGDGTRPRRGCGRVTRGRWMTRRLRGNLDPESYI